MFKVNSRFCWHLHRMRCVWQIWGIHQNCFGHIPSSLPVLVFTGVVLCFGFKGEKIFIEVTRQCVPTKKVIWCSSLLCQSSNQHSDWAKFLIFNLEIVLVFCMLDIFGWFFLKSIFYKPWQSTVCRHFVHTTLFAIFHPGCWFFRFSINHRSTKFWRGAVQNVQFIF